MHGQGQDSFTWKRLVVVIVFIWAFSIGIASPTMLEYAVQDVEISYGASNQTRTLKFCGSFIPRELASANAIFVFFISYIIPVILMTKTYSQIAKLSGGRGNGYISILGQLQVVVCSNTERGLSNFLSL